MDNAILQLCFWTLTQRPQWGGNFIFAFSGIRRPLSHLVSGHFKEKYLSYLYQVWYGVYWVNSLHGIAFGEDSSIANRVIAT